MPTGLSLLVALLFAASPKLDAAVDLYQSGEYDKAQRALPPLVDGADLALPERARALAYLAAAQLGAKDQSGAKAQFTRLAKDFPDYRLSAMEFLPEVVALADEARAEVQAAAKAGAQPQPPQPLPEPPAKPVAPAPAPLPHAGEPAPSRGERSVRVRLGAFGFGEPLARSLGAGASAGVSISGVDLSARLLLGSKVGFGAEVAYRFRDGSLVQPRLALRFSGVPGASAWGGGAVAGVQLALTRNLWLGAEAGVEYFSAGAGYRPLAVPLALGIGAQL